MSQIPPEYIAIGRIVTMLEECVAARGECWFSRWTDDPNPTYCQTVSGLFLQVDQTTNRSEPWRLWTPWGEQLLTKATRSSASAAWADVTAAVLPRLGATMYIGKGSDTPNDIYSLSKVDDLQLPVAVMRDPGDYVGRDEIKRAWQDVVNAACSGVSP